MLHDPFFNDEDDDDFEEFYGNRNTINKKKATATTEPKETLDRQQQPKQRHAVVTAPSSSRSDYDQQWDVDHSRSSVSLVPSSSNYSTSTIAGRSVVSEHTKRTTLHRKKSQEVFSNVAWEDDAVARICFVCRTEFNLVRRKHHCRQCGRVICSHCSVFLELSHAISNKKHKKKKKKKKHRVCTKCAAKPPEPNARSQEEEEDHQPLFHTNDDTWFVEPTHVSEEEKQPDLPIQRPTLTHPTSRPEDRPTFYDANADELVVDEAPGYYEAQQAAQRQNQQQEQERLGRDFPVHVVTVNRLPLPVPVSVPKVPIPNDPSPPPQPAPVESSNTKQSQDLTESTGGFANALKRFFGLSPSKRSPIKPVLSTPPSAPPVQETKVTETIETKPEAPPPVVSTIATERHSVHAESPPSIRPEPVDPGRFTMADYSVTGFAEKPSKPKRLQRRDTFEDLFASPTNQTTTRESEANAQLTAARTYAPVSALSTGVDRFDRRSEAPMELNRFEPTPVPPADRFNARQIPSSPIRSSLMDEFRPDATKTAVDDLFAELERPSEFVFDSTIGSYVPMHQRTHHAVPPPVSRPSEVYQLKIPRLYDAFRPDAEMMLNYDENIGNEDQDDAIVDKISSLETELATLKQLIRNRRSGARSPVLKPQQPPETRKQSIFESDESDPEQQQQQKKNKKKQTTVTNKQKPTKRKDSFASLFEEPSGLDGGYDGLFESAVASEEEKKEEIKKSTRQRKETKPTDEETDDPKPPEEAKEINVKKQSNDRVKTTQKKEIDAIDALFDMHNERSLDDLFATSSNLKTKDEVHQEDENNETESDAMDYQDVEKQVDWRQLKQRQNQRQRRRASTHDHENTNTVDQDAPSVASTTFPDDSSRKQQVNFETEEEEEDNGLVAVHSKQRKSTITRVPASKVNEDEDEELAVDWSKFKQRVRSSTSSTSRVQEHVSLSIDELKDKEQSSSSTVVEEQKPRDDDENAFEVDWSKIKPTRGARSSSTSRRTEQQTASALKDTTVEDDDELDVDWSTIKAKRSTRSSSTSMRLESEMPPTASMGTTETNEIDRGFDPLAELDDAIVSPDTRTSSWALPTTTSVDDLTKRSDAPTIPTRRSSRRLDLEDDQDERPFGAVLLPFGEETHEDHDEDDDETLDHDDGAKEEEEELVRFELPSPSKRSTRTESFSSSLVPSKPTSTADEPVVLGRYRTPSNAPVPSSEAETTLTIPTDYENDWQRMQEAEKDRKKRLKAKQRQAQRENALKKASVVYSKRLATKARSSQRLQLTNEPTTVDEATNPQKKKTKKSKRKSKPDDHIGENARDEHELQT